MNLNTRIINRRNELGIKQSELATLTNLAPSTISQIESGNRQPSLDALISISKALKVSLDYLINGTNDNKLLPANQDPKLPVLIKGFKDLDEDEKEQLIDYYFFIINRRKDKSNEILPNTFNPTSIATDILNALNIKRLPIDIKQIASNYNVDIIETLFDKDFDGCLMKNQYSPKILINSHVFNEERKKFTIAHMLGHLLIPWHMTNIYECRKRNESSILDNNLQEIEANEFAAELLMPLEHVLKDLNKKELNLNFIENLAQEKYKVSFTALAVRFIKSSHDKLALIRLKHGKYYWHVKSPQFHYKVKEYYSHKTHPTLGSNFVADQTKWLESDYGNIMLKEDILYFPDYDEHYILLSVKDLE